MDGEAKVGRSGMGTGARNIHASEGVLMTVSLKRAGRGTLVALAAFSALILPGATTAQAAAAVTPIPPPAGVITVKVEAINGTGCKPGSVKVTPSSDNTSFRVRYNDFVAQAGDGAEAVQHRKNCQSLLKVHIPQGFTFAIAEATYRGHMRLPTGAHALLKTSFYFQGDSGTGDIEHSFTEPYVGDWSVSDVTPVAALVYAKCGEVKYLNVNSELRVYTNDAKDESTISMRASKTDVDTIFNFSWKKC